MMEAAGTTIRMYDQPRGLRARHSFSAVDRFKNSLVLVTNVDARLVAKLLAAVIAVVAGL